MSFLVLSKLCITFPQWSGSSTWNWCPRCQSFLFVKVWVALWSWFRDIHFLTTPTFYKWLTFTSEPCHLQCCHSILSPEILLVAHFIFIAHWQIRPHSVRSNVGLSGICCVPGSLLWPMRTNHTLSLLLLNHIVMERLVYTGHGDTTPLMTQTSPQDFGPEIDDENKNTLGTTAGT